MPLGDWFRRKEDATFASPKDRLAGDPPPARRIAARALVLAVLQYRLLFEQFRLRRAGEDDWESCYANALTWAERVGLGREYEPEELERLETPLGGLRPDAFAEESWRLEGLGVLSWALQHYRLPPYDVPVGREAMENLGLFNEPGSPDLCDLAVPRPFEEIRRYASHITIASWRLRQFQLPPSSPIYRELIAAPPPWGHGMGERMDFEAHLRAHPRFQDDWLECLSLIDGDLAFGGRSIADASPEDLRRYTGIAVMRQVAAYWLRGDHALYSRVSPSTLLLEC